MLSTTAVRFWFRWGLAVVTAVLVSMVIISTVSRDDDVAGCERNSSSKIIDAHFYERAAQQRHSEGQHEVAQDYEKLAWEKRQTIPVPSAFESYPDRGDTPTERKAGCERAFPPLLPFIK